MKVIRVTTELNYGGIEKVFELHAKYHVKNFELVFLALGKGGVTEKVLQELGFRVIILDNHVVKIPSIHLLVELVKLFKTERPDVVHTAGAEANFHGTVAAIYSGVDKIICEEIGIPEHNFKARLLFRIVYKFASFVIAISKAVESYLISSKEVPSKKVKLLYNPINEPIILNQAKEEFLFTIVARLEPIKNIPLLIDAFYELQNNIPRAKLTIIGEGSQKHTLQQQVKDLQIEDKVLFTGFISDPTPLLTKSSYFVLPSLFEGFGLACIEAIQANNIVICTNSGGIPEFIEDKKQGFLIDPTSKENLIDAMHNAVSLTEGARQKMIDSAKSRIGQMFSPHRYVKELTELYSK